MSEFTEETATVGDVTFQSEIIAKYQRQKSHKMSNDSQGIKIR